MARASSATAGLESAGPSMAAGINFDKTGMSYTMRFTKGWSLTSSFFGETLPIRFDGNPHCPVLCPLTRLTI
jgi:hypothetical protein